MTRALVITNPAAARTDARAVDAIRETLRGGGWTVEVQATARPGDARRFALEARDAGIDVLVCHGGDGTEMTAAAARVILRGHRLALDLGVVDRIDAPHYFAVCGGAGFDARLMADTHATIKRRWKRTAYLVRGLAALPGVRSALHRVTVDGVPHERRAALVLVANCGDLFPPFLRLRHDIAPDDGWFDVLTLDADGTLGSLAAFWELMRGRWSHARGLGERVWFGRGRSVQVEVVAGEQQPVQLDGELTGETPFEARLLPGALSVLVDPARLRRR